MKNLFTKLFLTFCVSFFAGTVYAQETPNQAIVAAKVAIEQAVKLGAGKDATDDLASANSWLSEAEKANSLIGAVVSMAISEEAKKNRADDIVYLATMAKIKAQTAETKAKKYSITVATQQVQKDLDDFLVALALTKNKQDEVNKLKAELEKASATNKELETKLKDAPKKE
jgi:galactitol-specific phosphotransferase system IIB component